MCRCQLFMQCKWFWVELCGAVGGARFFTFLEDSHGPGDHDHGGQDNKGNGVFCIRICYKLCAHLNLLEIWQFTKFTVSLSSLSRGLSCTADYLLTTYAQYQLINSKKTLFAKTLSYALFESSTRTEVTQCKNVI